MTTRKLLLQFAASAFAILLLIGCGTTPIEPATIPTSTLSPMATTTSSPIPTLAPDIGALPYVPVTPEICQIIQELATQAIAATFSMETNVPFIDPLTGELGQGCTLTATGTGVDFADPGSVMSGLINGMLGWTEQTAYQADGPTGSATAMTRDMALMLIDVGWSPTPEAQCPADQPISACDLKPEQKLYTIQIQTAMK